MAAENTICSQYTNLIILWKIEDRVWECCLYNLNNVQLRPSLAEDALIMRIFIQIPICKGISRGTMADQGVP